MTISGVDHVRVIKKSGIRRNHGTCRDGHHPGLIYGLGEVFNIFSGVGKKTSPDKIIDSLNARLVGHFLFLNFLLFLPIFFLIYLTKVSNNCWENSELVVILSPT